MAKINGDGGDGGAPPPRLQKSFIILYVNLFEFSISDFDFRFPLWSDLDMMKVDKIKNKHINKAIDQF